MDNNDRTFNNGYFGIRASRTVVQKLINGVWTDTHTDVGDGGISLVYLKYGHRDDLRILDENGVVMDKPFDREYNHKLYNFADKETD